VTPEQFCYWLQGFAELNGSGSPTPAQWKAIKEHVATVFNKVTPPVEPKPFVVGDFKFDQNNIKMYEMLPSASPPVLTC
jgi:hypothetical protein